MQEFIIPELVAKILLRSLTQYPNFWSDDWEDWEAAWKWVEDHRGNVEEMGQ